ncbi:putative hydrolase of the HAD superfamily [Nocardia amikacinitolerans]|uniref:Putative hydrolase of the HAD superfamily n=1 Tax=Nocardia amikacinitolerans TaxID=756689 RepID=A0A285LX08_9NOCA|nr:HAD family phosphatase [Nocardia amikacinitolerans]MCP2279540.1 putative hydrolase of the HAD superfamily [Nocardia amikacinitolerans]MCP2298566.1 putative hydrolase of the HAD superfamily [Nocardia amikacinitolerans]SNY89460.1 putative hydrolase of the HAD superfamily [Nocardia amikacinitolerans]
MSAADTTVPFVWFDFGGVLSPPLDELFLRYEQVAGIPVDLFKYAIAEVGAQYGLAPLAPIELALLDERAWVGKLHAVLRAKAPELDLSRSEPDFGRQWFAGHRVNSAVREFAIELAESGTRVGVLSNNVVEWEPYWRAMIDLDDVLSALIDSCKVGFRKPDPEIFAIAAESAGVEPHQCILVDDLAENCAAARESGWTAVRFRDAGQAIGEVREALERWPG